MKPILDRNCYALKPAAELDYALAADGLACQHRYDSAVARFHRAQTVDDRTKALNDIKFLSDLALEAKDWNLHTNIDPIGQLYRHLDGRFHISLFARLDNIRTMFLMAGDNSGGAEAVNRALWMIMLSPNKSIFEMASVIQYWHRVQELFGERLRGLASCPANSRAKEAKKLKKDLAYAVDRIATPSFVAPRKNAWRVQVKDDKGVLRDLRLEVVVIDIAARLAERHQEAPAKGDIRVALCAIFPELNNCKDSTWTNIWKRCGLDELPMAPKWTVAGKTTG